MPKFNTLEKLLLISLLAFVLRIWNIENGPVSLNQDEAVNGVDAFTVGLNLRDHHGNFLPPMLQSFNDWASPTLTYLTVPFVKLFGLNVFSIRLANGVFGVLCVPLIFSIIKRLTGSKLASLMTAFVVALSPFMISLSRWAIPPSIVPFCLLGFIWAVLRLLDSDYTNSKKAFVHLLINNILVTLSAAALVYSYPTMKVFGPLAALLLLGVYFKTHFVKLLPSIALFFVLISPIYYLTLTQPQVYNARYDSVKVTARGESMIGGMSARYWEYLTPNFLTGVSDTNSMHHVPMFGPINEILGFFIYFGVILAICLATQKIQGLSEGEKDYRLYIYLLGLLALAPLPPSLTIDHIILTRGVQVLVLAFVLIGISFGYIEKLITNSYLKKALIGGFAFLLLFSSVQFFTFYHSDYKEDSKGNFQYGIKEMYAYLKQNEASFDRVEVTDINQPYIYQMFFNKVEPGSYIPSDMSCNIGKYYYCGVEKNQTNGKIPIYTVNDTNGKGWFYVFEPSPRNWVVTR